MIENLEGEIWKDVPLSIYSISNFGRVRTNNYNHTKRVAIMKVVTHTRYIQLTMHIDRKKRTKHVHRLVAEHFVSGKSETNNVVNHIDGNAHNNHFQNLEWVSMLENNTHKWKKKERQSSYHGVSRSGVKNRVRWVASININGKKKNLGTHDTEIEAYQAYLKALKDNNITNKYATAL